MLTQIVVLFMATQLKMPEWCRVAMYIALGINIIRLLWGMYKAGMKVGKENE